MKRILLVEHDDGDARRIDETLRGRGDWEVTRAATLLEAIRAAGERRFDAAVLDADLPDGSGLDILDFLRIGSPGIRILLVADKATESVAFHALSHGAGDFIVKGLHLEQELPHRMQLLLDGVEPATALVETLRVGHYDEPGFAAASAPASRHGSALEETLEDIARGSVLAAGVWDLHGRPVATRLAADQDAEGLGFAMATLHGQVGALWTYGNLKPSGYRLVVDVEGGLLAVTAIPGTYLVALLFDEGFAPRRALDRIDEAGLRVLATLQGGSSGSDLPPRS